jgi:hypothetical protein
LSLSSFVKIYEFIDLNKIVPVGFLWIGKN